MTSLKRVSASPARPCSRLLGREGASLRTGRDLARQVAGLRVGRRDRRGRRDDALGEERRRLLVGAALPEDVAANQHDDEQDTAHDHGDRPTLLHQAVARARESDLEIVFLQMMTLGRFHRPINRRGSPTRNSGQHATDPRL
jgi:hypothetical protein